MKSHVKFFILLMTSILLYSCGGDDNKVNTNTNPTITTNGYNPNVNGFSTQDEQQLMNQLKSTLQCPQGQVLQNIIGTGQRVNDLVFSKPLQSADHTKVCGQFSQGTQVQGSTGQMYVGVSAYNDIMIVTELINGSQVIGHRVTISMCGQNIVSGGGWYGQQQTQIPYIDNQRQLTNFRTQNNSCIVLDKDNFCSYGVVDFASQTVLTAAPIQTNGLSLQQVDVYTSFAKPTCNQQY